MKSTCTSHSARSWHRQSGQAMTEYVIVTAFGLMLLLGPGIDILKEMANVFRRNYDGYSYAMSLSALPDYGTGEQMRTAMLAEQIDQATIDQLGVDPLVRHEILLCHDQRISGRTGLFKATVRFADQSFQRFG